MDKTRETARELCAASMPGLTTTFTLAAVCIQNNAFGGHPDKVGAIAFPAPPVKAYNTPKASNHGRAMHSRPGSRAGSVLPPASDHRDLSAPQVHTDRGLDMRSRIKSCKASKTCGIQRLSYDFRTSEVEQ
jgi:hypothetical protein